MSKHAAARSKKFSQMNRSEKIVFVLNCVAYVPTMGYAYPNVLTVEDR